MLIPGCTLPDPDGNPFQHHTLVVRGSLTDIGDSNPIVEKIQSVRGPLTILMTSHGGRMSEWMSMVRATTRHHFVEVVLAEYCDSGCLMYALTIRALGVPVRVESRWTHLRWDGPYEIGTGPGTEVPARAVRSEVWTRLWLWHRAGTPRWVIDTIILLNPGESREISPSEFDRSGFVYD